MSSTLVSIEINNNEPSLESLTLERVRNLDNDSLSALWSDYSFQDTRENSLWSRSVWNR